MTGMGREAAFGIAATALEKVAALGIALWLPRHLELADYGRYTLVIAFLGLFQALPDASLETVLVARLARADGVGDVHTVALAGRAALVRLGVSLGGAAAGLLAIALVSDEPAVVGAGACWALGLALAAANPYRALLRAELRLSGYLALAAMQTAVTIGALAAVVAFGGGLAAVLAVGAAGAAGGLVLGRLLVGAGARLRADRPLAAALARSAWPLAGTTLFITGAQQTLAGLLARTHGPEALGLLGGAQRITDAVNFLPQALVVSLLPALARADVPRARDTARDAAHALAVLLAPLAAVLAVWPAVPLDWILGPQFVAAAPVLRVLAAVTVLTASGSVLTAHLVAGGRQGVLLAVTAASALVTLGLGVALVLDGGALGVAVAQAGGMLVGQLALVAIGDTRRVAAAVLAAVGRPLALACAAGALAAAAGVSGPVAVAVLVLGYATAVLLTRTVTREDLARWSR